MDHGAGCRQGSIAFGLPVRSGTLAPDRTRREGPGSVIAERQSAPCPASPEVLGQTPDIRPALFAADAGITQMHALPDALTMPRDGQPI
jgi:hypothetical protein